MPEYLINNQVFTNFSFSQISAGKRGYSRVNTGIHSNTPPEKKALHPSKYCTCPPMPV